MIKRILNKFNISGRKVENINSDTNSLIKQYKNGGCIPWSKGYSEFKELLIENSINNQSFLDNLKKDILPSNFGVAIDERCVEYPWIFSNLNIKKGKILDAGSTFNFEYLLKHSSISDNELSIFTYYPERNCFHQKRVSYIYGDLRDMPFKNELFDVVICHSTIEHIAMDNSIYGYGTDSNLTHKSYEYLDAIKELIRVIKTNGTLLLTFPFGKFENHGFFQQFDDEMLTKIENLFTGGKYEITFFKYEQSGWKFAKRNELMDTISFNPHTGTGKGNDGAAHCRSVACIKWIKSLR